MFTQTRENSENSEFMVYEADYSDRIMNQVVSQCYKLIIKKPEVHHASLDIDYQLSSDEQLLATNNFELTLRNYNRVSLVM